MKIKIDDPILDYDGTPIPGATFRQVFSNVLHSASQQDVLTAEDKQKGFQIGVKLFEKKLDEYDLTTDQIAYLKRRINVFHGELIYGRFLQLIGDLSNDKGE